MKHGFWITTLAIVCAIGMQAQAASGGNARTTVHALYVPLADHYAALVAYERYRQRMQHADFRIEQMKNWDLLRAFFESGEVDVAFVTSPLAMDMFLENPRFRWIGLMHRDGNALAINDKLDEGLALAIERNSRKPDSGIADALKKSGRRTGRATEIGIPHLMATHSVVLYRYLSENGVSLSLKPGEPADVLAIPVSPSNSPAFIRGKSNRAEPAAFEQSLPWADVVETGGYGRVAWYSKDVMPWKHGHVECITIASDDAIADKFDALKEVMEYIHLAGTDIEFARLAGGAALDEIVEIVRRHIPAHTRDAIIASLDPDLRVINYQHLNVDKPGLKQIMDLAVKGRIIRSPIDIEAFADTRFGTPNGGGDD